MNISFHFISSIPLIAVLYPFFGDYTFLIFIGSFLIDFDHYLWSVVKFKNLSLKKSYQYHKSIHSPHKERDVLHIFHTIEFLILMVITTIILFKLNQIFFYKSFLMISLGIIYHQLFDFGSLIKHHCRHPRAISLIAWIRRH
jgi:hypothetical protein